VPTRHGRGLDIDGAGQAGCSRHVPAVGAKQARKEGAVKDPNWYPKTLRVSDDGTAGTYRFLETVYEPLQPFTYAEFGIWKADTAANVCQRFPNAILHLFDFEDNIRAAQEKLSAFPNQIIYYGNSQRYNDSYNWALGKLILQGKAAPMFDYCFLDGAHTFAVDALNYFLCDRLLHVGGYMDFDDYNWKLRSSSLRPSRVPEILLQYTEEQISAPQVKMIVDGLVKTDPRYVERVPNKVYQKIRA
jgi:hypothetical protein